MKEKGEKKKAGKEFGCPFEMCCVLMRLVGYLESLVLDQQCKRVLTRSLNSCSVAGVTVD